MMFYGDIEEDYCLRLFADRLLPELRQRRILSNICISSTIHREKLWPVEVNHMVGVIFNPYLSIPRNVINVPFELTEIWECTNVYPLGARML
jgi:hypothetical protein